jgi:uncharacterized protein YlxW (UPF0749 family)
LKRKIPFGALIILSTLLGLLISIQLKTVNMQTGGYTTSQRGQQLASQLNKLNEKEDALKSELSALEDKLSKYKTSESNSDVALRSINEDIKKYEKLSGYTDVRGQGIDMKIIGVGQDPNANMLIYNYELLLSVVNKLNAAQADAISINEQRIVANTAIELSGEKLLINDTPISPPFVVKAIGNADTLESALKLKYGVIWEIENYYNAKVDIEKKENIKIPRYSKEIKYKYANPVE